jgi:phosphoglycerate dehydrogenase-like enzyme
VDGTIGVLAPDGSVDGFAGLQEEPDVLLFSPSVPRHPEAMRALLTHLGAPGLRWVQGPGAGIDHPMWQGLLDRGVRLTNASGIHADPIAQYIFTYVLFWERNVARHLEQEAARHWEIIRSGDLSSKTLGIVGYGGIGRAAARVAKAFGMRTLGSRRSVVEGDPLLDEYVPSGELERLFRESHYVLLCMPFNDETRGMIGREALGAMRDDAVLINVARGGVVDEPELVRVLEAGRIRGATLDVTAEEPLPEDSPLWTLPNCVITPHDAGYSPLGDERLGELFLENLRLFVTGERMVNEVDSTGLVAS